jgi:hypothetical protein
VQFSSRLRWFDALLLTAAAFFSVVTVAAISLAPKDNATGIAVIFAPWTSASDAMTRAVEPGGRFVRFGAFDFIAVVEPAGSEYAYRVRSNGAWLLADPAALAACLKPFKTSKS